MRIVFQYIKKEKPRIQQTKPFLFPQPISEDLLKLHASANQSVLTESEIYRLLQHFKPHITHRDTSALAIKETSHFIHELHENSKENIKRRKRSADRINLGIFSSPIVEGEKIGDVMKEYTEGYYNLGQTRKKREYKFHSSERKEWSTSEWKRFYEGVKLYPNNNSKIAKYMGSEIQSNHVRYEKSRFMKTIKKQKLDLNQIVPFQHYKGDQEEKEDKNNIYNTSPNIQEDTNINKPHSIERINNIHNRKSQKANEKKKKRYEKIACQLELQSPEKHGKY